MDLERSGRRVRASASVAAVSRRLADLLGGEEAVEAGAGAQVEDRLAPFEAGDGRRIATAEAQIRAVRG